MKKKNILMIGMPASGKSTIGVLLAKRLGYSFVDVDLVIQEKTGKLFRRSSRKRAMTVSCVSRSRQTWSWM